MEQFFNTLYYYTNNFYCIELDNYLYEKVPGYLHNGIVLLILSIIFCIAYYYVKAPVKKQMLWWFIFAGFNAISNFFFGLWYTMTPLINNEIEISEEWSYFDCFVFGLVSSVFSFVFFVIISLLIKWWSPAKFIPFRKF